jgi:hypothetical protein
MDQSKLKRNEGIGIITEYKSEGGEKKLIIIKKRRWMRRLSFTLRQVQSSVVQILK